MTEPILKQTVFNYGFIRYRVRYILHNGRVTILSIRVHEMPTLNRLVYTQSDCYEGWNKVADRLASALEARYPVQS